MRRIKVILAALAAMTTMTVMAVPAMAQTFVGSTSGVGNDGIDVSGVPVTSLDDIDAEDFVLVFVPEEDAFLLLPEDFVDDRIDGVVQGFDIGRVESGASVPVFVV